MLQVTKLPSGLQVATYKLSSQAAGVYVTIRAGKRYENQSEKGLSHFLEHLLFNGTKGYPTEQKLNDSVRSLGGDLGARTSTEWVGFYAKVLKEHLNQAIKTISEQLQYPLLQETSIQKEMGVIQNELTHDISSSSHWSGRKIMTALWQNQSLGTTDEEQIENLKNININLLRNFMKKFYIAGNMVIAVAGDLDHKEVSEKVAKYFSDLPQGNAPNFKPAESSHGIKLISKAGYKHVSVVLGFYGPDHASSDRFATRLLGSILSQKLMEKIRYELGFVYGIGTRFFTFQDTGGLTINFSNLPGKTTEVLKQVQSELKEIRLGSITNKELDRAKARVKSNFVFQSESSLGLADEYSFRVLFDLKPLLVSEAVKEFEKVSMEEINNVASTYLDLQNFKIAAAGPKKDIEELEKLYGK